MAAIVRDTGLQTGSAVGTDSASFGTLPAVGNHIKVASGIWEVAAPSMTGVSDNQSNSYVEDIERAAPSADCGASLYSAKVATSAGTFTVTIDPAGSVWVEWIAFEVSGLDGTTWLDQTGSATSTTGTASATAAGANATADGISIAVVAVANETDSAIALTPNSYTALATNNDAAATIGFCCAYKIRAGVSETSSESFSHDTGGAGWAEVIGTYRDAAGAGGQPTSLRGGLVPHWAGRSLGRVA